MWLLSRPRTSWPHRCNLPWLVFSSEVISLVMEQVPSSYWPWSWRFSERLRKMWDLLHLVTWGTVPQADRLGEIWASGSMCACRGVVTIGAFCTHFWFFSCRIMAGSHRVKPDDHVSLWLAVAKQTVGFTSGLFFLLSRLQSSCGLKPSEGTVLPRVSCSPKVNVAFEGGYIIAVRSQWELGFQVTVVQPGTPWPMQGWLNANVFQKKH